MNVFKAILAGRCGPLPLRIGAGRGDGQDCGGRQRRGDHPLRAERSLCTLSGKNRSGPRGLDREKALAENKMLLLRRLVDNLLMEQQARKVGIVIRDEEVMGTIRRNAEEKEHLPGGVSKSHRAGRDELGG